MPLQKQPGPAQTHWTLLVVLGVIAVVAAGVLYWIFIYNGASTAPASSSTATPAAVLNTQFQSDVLSDPRLKNLKPHGDAEVTVDGRGSRPDPFIPF